MKFKKTFRDLKYGVLKPKIFIILFGLFFLFNTNLSIAEIVFTQEAAARPDHVEPSYKDLNNEIFNILKSKRDEIILKLELPTKEEFDILKKRVENLERSKPAKIKKRLKKLKR